MADNRTVKVYARLRPTQNFAYDNIVLQPDGKTVDVHGRQSDKGGHVNNQILDWSFKLDGVLHDVSQDLIYEVAVKNVVSEAFAGYNGTIMCYGQTGSGKTFTMTGANESFQNRGLIPRAIQQVFREVGQMPDYAVNIKISYLEVYNETLFDLLGSGSGNAMTILEDELGIKVNGLTQHIANNEEEALNLLFEGETTRAIAAHQMNKHSSRSHVIFSIQIESRCRTESSTEYTVSKLNFVDLAGSERLGKTSSSGRTQSEATYINKSLTFLEQTIIAITDKKRDHVPFRQSKLTHVLKDSIGGNCNTVMFANIWGELDQIEETVSTLRFGCRMMRVPVSAAINQVTDPTAMVRRLEKEVRTLKQELTMQDTLNNKSNLSYDTLTDAQLAEVTRQVNNYVNGASDAIDIANIRQIQAVFAAFKNHIKNLEKDVEARLAAQPAQPAAAGGAPPPDPRTPGGPAPGPLVGELDGAGFGVGVSGDRKPSKGGVLEQKRQALANQQKRQGGRSSREASPAPSPPSPNTAAADRPATPPPRHIAFEDFKKDEGAGLNRILAENKDMLKTKVNESRDMANQVNETKRNIDETREQINLITNSRDQLGGLPDDVGGRVVEESEYHLLLQLGSLKKQYRERFTELQRLRSETQYCQKLVDQCRQRLISDFDNWYLQSYVGPNVEFTPTVNTNYGQAQSANLSSIGEDDGEKLERQRTNIMMQDPDSYNYHQAKRNTIRKYTHDKSSRQDSNQASQMIVPPKKPTQMILTAPY